MEQKRSNLKTEIQFKPLTDGLGFHPFSDGLPYAPVSKKNTAPLPPRPTAAPSSGAGAVSAGPPRFVTQAPRVSVPVAPRAPIAPIVAAPAAAPQFSPAQESPILEAAAEPRYGFGYLISRALAYLVDTSMNLVLCLALLSVALWRLDLKFDTLLSSGVIGLTALFLFVLNWALIAAQEIAFGTSLGKRMFGLALDGGAIAVFVRAFFFVPSLCFGGIGLLWSVVDRKKRCWHDLVVSLQPIEIARL